MNHLYKVIYLRHAKTASSSLFCHFGGCRDNATTGSDESSRLRFEPLQARETYPIPGGLLVWEARTGPAVPQHQLNLPHLQRCRNPAPAAAMWMGLRLWQSVCPATVRHLPPGL